MKYQLIVRNKFVCLGSKSFDDFVINLEKHLEFIKELQLAGVTLLPEGIDDDYATFETEDKSIATEFGFEEVIEEDMG